MNNSGVVMKVEGDEAIVMTDFCTFEIIRKSEGMFPGQKVTFNPSDISGLRKKRMGYYYTVIGSVAAVFVLLFSYFGFFRVNEPYAYLDIDINPSLEFAIDENNILKDINPMNEDAEILVRGMNLKNLSAEDALIKIMEKSKEQGFLRPVKSFVLVSAALNDKSKGYKKDRSGAESRLNMLLGSLKEELKSSKFKNIKHEIIKVPSEYRTKSIESKVSMGKYLFFEKVKELGKSISIEELRSEDLSVLLEKYNMSLTEPVAGTGDLTPAGTPASTASPHSSLYREHTNIPAVTSASRPSVTPGVLQNSPVPSISKGLIINVSTPSLVFPDIFVTNVPSGSYSVTPSPVIIPDTTQKTVGMGTGLRGEYYDNLDFTDFKFSRIDPKVDFDWGSGSPGPSMKADIFSVRWTGQIIPEYSETYTFFVNSDDGVRLWINNKLIIDCWKPQYDGAKEFCGKISLTAGKKYAFKMEYFDDVNDASAKLFWCSHSQKKEIIPSSQLYPGDEPTPPEANHGLMAQYFNDLDFKNLKMTRTDPVINFNWFTRAPDDVLNKDKFTVRWTGKIDSRYSEDYTFNVLADDGVRLWINNVLVIDQWGAKGKEREWKGNIYMRAGKKYDIKMEYFDDTGNATVKLSWSSKRQARQIVSSIHLYPE